MSNYDVHGILVNLGLYLDEVECVVVQALSGDFNLFLARRKSHPESFISMLWSNFIPLESFSRYEDKFYDATNKFSIFCQVQEAVRNYCITNQLPINSESQKAGVLGIIGAYLRHADLVKIERKNAAARLRVKAMNEARMEKLAEQKKKREAQKLDPEWIEQEARKKKARAAEKALVTKKRHELEIVKTEEQIIDSIPVPNTDLNVLYNPADNWDDGARETRPMCFRKRRFGDPFAIPSDYDYFEIIA